MPPVDNTNAKTLVSLRDHLEARLDAQCRYFEARLIALEKANEVAAEALKLRLNAMNEIRESMRDQGTRMATRSELEQCMASLTKDVRDARDAVKQREVVGATKLEMDAELKAINAELRLLHDFRTGMEAKASQKSVNIALVLSVVGLLVGVVLHFI